MVRTADSYLRVGGKSSKKGVGGNTNSNESSRSRSPSSGSGDRGAGGLNPICPRETPSWQKPITNFFTHVERPNNYQSKEIQDTSSSSKNVPEDVNMMEDDDPQTNEYVDTNKNINNVEVMDEEFQEIKIVENKIDMENKENDSPNDAEMNGFKAATKKKVNVREDDENEDMVPRKKMKLGGNLE